ncbi:uncharacterized protein A1O9_09582 [Exophiala aquamarina CBS 119918]|uniref:Cellulose-binding Sde182 C-terminal domain-containing protein n=1 Tax=Exophiala aquamarina CBS 119918 TaxID=1182545 RepID=A0A072P3J4_9EURO|nr:uncharacterized protein A1O9_09582 [Exophiala aquamarina CBS 119918]KEF54416.1 hypothetical protein A1O9_09582 [Exophiala aquamarina CBS 119918]
MLTDKAMRKGQMLHFILDVKDNGTPQLTTYKRVVVQTTDLSLKGQGHKATETLTHALGLRTADHY